jgi:uncharacterized membrane protein YdbT with pleckstrin-like domain
VVTVLHGCYGDAVGFPRELLADHEEIVFDLKPHWVAVVPSVIWTVVATAAIVTSFVFLDGLVALVAAGLVALLWVFLAVAPFVTWQFTRFVLTTDRLITRSGVIAKRSKEIPLERINDVAFSQTVLDRILGAGDLLIESAGERGQGRIENVRNPERVQLMIFEESEKNNNRMMQPREQAGASITDQIEALARLKDQGVISDIEFENKKADLLKRM